MDATLIVIDSDAELARARALVDRLWDSDDPTDIARFTAQARLIAAYEESKWPRRHGLTRADLVPLLGHPQPRQRSPTGQEGAQHGHGTTPARPFPSAGRSAPSATPQTIGTPSHCSLTMAPWFELGVGPENAMA